MFKNLLTYSTAKQNKTKLTVTLYLFLKDVNILRIDLCVACFLFATRFCAESHMHDVLLT